MSKNTKTITSTRDMEGFDRLLPEDQALLRCCVACQPQYAGSISAILPAATADDDDDEMTIDEVAETADADEISWLQDDEDIPTCPEHEARVRRVLLLESPTVGVVRSGTPSKQGEEWWLKAAWLKAAWAEECVHRLPNTPRLLRYA